MGNKTKTVVIGGSGFLGSHLADALSDAGYAVTIFDRCVSPWLRENQNMVVGNILDLRQITEALEGARYVYHLAGVADISRSALNPRETIELNIIGSMNVIEACVKTKVTRLLFASTVYVYSRQGSFYRVSKQTVESILETYHDQFGLEYSILRYGSLYGPRAQDWNGLKRFVVQAVKEGRIVYPGTGEERREYIHVQDAAKLSIQALAPEFANRCLILTGTQILSTKDVMRMIGEILGRQIKIEFIPTDPDYEIFHYSLTPYRYTPRRGEKIVPNVFIDLGQGILNMVEEVENEHPGSH
ncbi:MAG: NAD(P)-dependent oxidoreductase [Deltaproteobacteria bacterium]|nr:NAD(P)-dependent oxidoreductase [Deltaproteobacteria bacterium]